MIDKIMVSDWKVEAQVVVNLHVNYYEVELTNMMCSGWLKVEQTSKKCPMQACH